MTEDLYAGKVTIRQLRRSLATDGGIEIKELYEELKTIGGPGVVQAKNYLIVPSSTFTRHLIGKYQGLLDPHVTMLLHQVNHHYCSRYVLTMLIVD